MLSSCHHAAMCHTEATLSQLVPSVARIRVGNEGRGPPLGFKHPASCVCGPKGAGASPAGTQSMWGMTDLAEEGMKTAHTCARALTFTHSHTHTHAHIHTCVCTHVHTHTYTHMHTCTRALHSRSYTRMHTQTLSQRHTGT